MGLICGSSWSDNMRSTAQGRSKPQQSHDTEQASRQLPQQGAAVRTRHKSRIILLLLRVLNALHCRLPIRRELHNLPARRHLWRRRGTCVRFVDKWRVRHARSLTCRRAAGCPVSESAERTPHMEPQATSFQGGFWLAGGAVAVTDQ